MAIRIVALCVLVLLLIGGPLWAQEETPPVEVPTEPPPTETLAPTATPTEAPTVIPTDAPTDVPIEITPELTEEPTVEVTTEVTPEVTDEIPTEISTATPTATAAPDEDGLITIEAEDAHVAQTGEWTTAANESASGGALLLSSGSTGDILTLGFNGTEVTVVYAQSPILGSFALEVDGAVVQVVQSNQQDNSTASAAITGLAEGEHTLRIVSTGGIVAIDTLTAAAFGSVIVEPTAEATSEITPEATVEAAQEPQLLGATTFVVSTAADVGPGSLRQALLDANANAGKDTITFNIPDCVGVCTIQPASALPAIFDAVVINGYSQPGSAAATSSTAATLLIEIDGQAVTGNGLTLMNGASVIKGLVINRFNGVGIAIESGATSSRIEGNYIGTDAAGTGDLGNTGVGINLNAVIKVTIGGTKPAARNLISGNEGGGIALVNTASQNKVQGNYIGTDVTGNSPLGNTGSGVIMTNSRTNTIGGSETGTRNVVSGNALHGFHISGNQSLNVIQGNTIGLGVDGSTDVGNGGDGIRQDSAPQTTYKNNVISGNAGHGINLADSSADNNKIEGNLIGLNAAGDAVVGNGLSGVVVFAGAGNRIGGSDSKRNVISGNGENGVVITDPAAEQNFIEGNYIGTDKTGQLDLGNGAAGILLSAGAHDTKIGGSNTSLRNLISGNGGHGIDLNAAPNNRVLGNYIGTNKNGSRALGNDGHGIAVAGDNNTIGGSSSAQRNVISGNGGNGISITGATVTIATGNYIGINAAGKAALPNAGSGVYIDSADTNFIGGWASGEGNVISGNGGDGITVVNTATDNQLSGNRIGTTANGSGRLGNQGNGVALIDVSGNVVGGLGCCGRNVISANGLNGVLISNASGNLILNSYIGTNASGTSDLGNEQNGVHIANGSTTNVIGYTDAPKVLVVISGNGGDGILIEDSDSNFVENTYIGLGADGRRALGNDGNGITLADASFNIIVPSELEFASRIANNEVGIAVIGSSLENAFVANRIYKNRSLGIDLGLDGVTPNDAGDGDGGPNGLLNFPVITAITADSITVTLDTDLPAVEVDIDFYRQSACDASGYGEGETWFDSIVGTTDGSGDLTITLTGISLNAGNVMTATVTATGATLATTSEFSACVPFVTDKPAVPSLSEPANNGHTNDNTPLLVWKPAKGAETYCVQVATDAQFTNLQVDTCDLLQQFFVPTTLSDGLYFWRVRGVNEVGQSNYSSARRFTVDTVAPTTAPELVALANDSDTNDTTPSFKWKVFPNAAHYQLELSTNPNCAAPFYVSPVLKKTGFTLPNANLLTVEDTYYWCVRADDLAGNWGPYSDSFQFGLTLLSIPKDGTTLKDTTPAFTWKAAPGSGVRYRLVINDAPDFVTPVFEQSDLSKTSFTLPNSSALLPDQMYFWTVQVTGGTWTTSEAIFWSFMLLAENPPAPGLDAPANGERTSDTTPTLSWFAVPPVGSLNISYTVQVDEQSDFSSPVFTQTGLTTLNTTISPALPASPGKKYYWRVRASYCDSGPTCADVTGPYSSARNFTLDTEPPLNFNLTAPANTSQVEDNPPTLRWQASNGAVEYLLRLDSNNPPTTALALLPGSTTQYTHGSTFAPGTYFWQVIARDAAANELPSQVFSFTIGEIADDTDTNIFVGEGYTDVSPKQVVRTTSNVLYTVLIDCSQYPECLGNSVRVYKGNQAGVPTSFERMDQADEPENALVVSVAIDGNNNIHIVYVQRSDQTNASRLDYVVFNTNTNSFGSVQTIDNALNYAGGGQGDQAAAVALDANGVPHVVYTKSDGTRRHVYYRNRIGGSWSAPTLVDQGVSYGTNQRAWHPNLAFDTHGRIVVAWMRGSFNAANDGTIFSRVRDTNGSWASIATISSNNGARVTIDQSTSLLITSNNRYHITYITSPNDYIRYAYSDDHGATWTHNNPGGGTQATHNPSLGFGPGGVIRIYGHGTPVPAPDGHGMNLYYYQGNGGGSGWGGWTQIIAGAYDSSVNTRWSQHFYYHPNFLDFVYWADPYPNLAYAASIVWN